MRRIDKKAFGEYIKEKRIEKGYTQDELASRLNVSSMSISKWENGRRYPDLEMLDDLSRELEVSVEEIYENSRREIVGGLPVNIGMIVIVLIVGFVGATGVLKVAKDKTDASDSDTATEPTTEIAWEGDAEGTGDIDYIEDVDVAVSDEAYSMKYGTYIDSTVELKPYINIIDEHRLMMSGSLWFNSAQFYTYERKGNTLYLTDERDENTKKIIGIRANENLVFESKTYVWEEDPSVNDDGVADIVISDDSEEDTIINEKTTEDIMKDDGVISDNNANSNKYIRRAIYLKTDNIPLFYIDGVGPATVGSLEKLGNADEIKKLETGAALLLKWGSEDDFLIEELYPANAYPADIEIIPEANIEQYVKPVEGDIFFERDTIVSDIKDNLEGLGYNIK